MSETIQKSSVLGAHLGLSAAAAAASSWLVSPRFGGSVALGAALAALNVSALFSFWERALLGRGGFGPGRFASFGVRFALLALALWAVLQAGAEGPALVLGLSLVEPAVILAAWRVRPAPAADAPALAVDDPSWDAWNPWLARERDPAETEDER